ncbi:MAG TPA: hypothetical protein VGL53_29460 [Bryobacteraceae bacterium]|jgi:hypothetical protein
MRNTILFLSALVACGQTPASAPGVPAKFETACDKANEGKRLMLEGYLDFPEHGFDDRATSVMMRLRPSLASWEFTVAASAKLGKGANHVEMPPSPYKKTDLKLHLSDGQVVGYANKVKASGTMYYVKSVGQGAYTCGLSNTLFERGGGWQPAPK